MVELLGSYPCGQLDLLRIGEALSSQSLALKQSPPRFLEVEPEHAPTGMKTCFITLE